MNDTAHAAMLEATRLTRAGQLTEATALLQRLLRGEPGAMDDPARDEVTTSPAPSASRIIDATPEWVEVAAPGVTSPDRQAFWSGTDKLPDALQGFVERMQGLGHELRRGGMGQPYHVPTPDLVPDGGQFVAGSYSGPAGSRAYKLYIPSCHRAGEALPLVVMLHGCTQSPDDFAAGTRMNALAEEHGCLVVYPAQSASANVQRCWNWFSPGDQQRGQGEPALIAGITRQVMREHGVDPQRVYVAGLSAGGAAAAIMAAAYPDLFAAVGVHSGLACGAASDLPSAFAAMQQGGAASHRQGSVERIVPAIVFHGDRDGTVHPRNGDQVAAQLRAAMESDLQVKVEQGQVSGGHAYSRTLHADASGRAILEQWVIHGAGHAWSGGSPAGSYTDARGPDAAREMLRFFLTHAHPAPDGSEPAM